jgi:catechol 2,3-dioxygenase
MPRDAETSIGAVELTVADLPRAVDFYSDAIGLATIEMRNAHATLGAGGAPLLRLTGDPDAPPRPRGSTGLFHVAFLVPARADLARSLTRLGERRWPLSGASDHLVSEALYLSDPEGNGIEIYRDRPRQDWPRAEGQIRMATLPLDLDSIRAELDVGAPDLGPVAADTRIGHVHLNVSDLGEAEAFYSGLLGFEVTVRSYPGALFLSAGGYHHHIGLNTWRSEGGPPPPEGSRGLRSFAVTVTDAGELDRIEAALRETGATTERTGAGVATRDPAGNGVLLATA